MLVRIIGEVDLKQLAAELPPWELSVDIDGRSYPTRPLTVGDQRFLAELRSGRIEDPGQTVAFVESLFPAEKPDVEKLDLCVVGALLAMMDDYGRARMRGFGRWRQSKEGSVA